LGGGGGGEVGGGAYHCMQLYDFVLHVQILSDAFFLPIPFCANHQLLYSADIAQLSTNATASTRGIPPDATKDSSATSTSGLLVAVGVISALSYLVLSILRSILLRLFKWALSQRERSKSVFLQTHVIGSELHDDANTKLTCVAWMRFHMPSFIVLGIVAIFEACLWTVAATNSCNAITRAVAIFFSAEVTRHIGYGLLVSCCRFRRQRRIGIPFTVNPNSDSTLEYGSDHAAVVVEQGLTAPLLSKQECGENTHGSDDNNNSHDSECS
jgi:hypothetical protein